MNKNNIVITALAVVVVFSVVMNFSTSSHLRSLENSINSLSGAVSQLQGSHLGGVGSFTNYSSLGLDGQLVYTGTSTPGGSVSFAGTVSGGVTQAPIFTGTCADATSTIFAIHNPFSGTSASSSAWFVEVTGTNGTSSVRILVATSTAISSQASNRFIVQPIVDSGNTISTSTTFTIYNGQSMAATSAPVTTVMLGANDEFLTGYAYPSAQSSQDNGGVTGLNNTFSCTYKVGIAQ